MSRLADIQTWFSNAVIYNRDSDQRSAQLFLTPSSRQSSADRLTVYTSDFWPRCLDSLEEDFPELRQYWGINRFHHWMRTYVIAHPSRSFTLYYLGQFFPRYIRDTYTDTDKELVISYADIEWARIVAMIAQNQPVFDPTQLTASHHSLLSSVVLHLHPSVSLIHFNHTPFIVYRKNFKRYEKTIEPILFDLLHLFKVGSSLSDAIAGLSDGLTPSQQEYVSTHIQTWFQMAVEDHWFIHPQFTGEEI